VHLGALAQDTAGRPEQIMAVEPESEWDPYWEYGAFVDVRDVATAVELALTVPLSGHHRAVPQAPDTSSGAGGPSPGLFACRHSARYRGRSLSAASDEPATDDISGRGEPAPE